MTRDAGFWRWYASTNDSIRHEVIERGWFERQTTANINEQDMPGMQSTPELGEEAELEELQHEDLYGHAPQLEEIEQEQD